MRDCAPQSLLCAAGLSITALSLLAISSLPAPAVQGGGRRTSHTRRTANGPAAASQVSVVVSYGPAEQYKSQDGQDKWANEHVFHGMTHGHFVDLGCYDGVTYSNTWYFERVLNWTGVCVEPNPEVFPRIASQAGRQSGLQFAVSDRHGKLPFVAAYMRSSLNASAVDYAFLATQGVRATSVEVTVTTPMSLLAGSSLAQVPVIDYVNIDVEQQV